MPDRGKHGGDISVDAVTQQLQQLRVARSSAISVTNICWIEPVTWAIRRSSRLTMAAADSATTVASSWPATTMTRP